MKPQKITLGARKKKQVAPKGGSPNWSAPGRPAKFMKRLNNTSPTFGYHRGKGKLWEENLNEVI